MATHLHAVVRTPSPNLASCELTWIARAPIDPGRAAHQHASYVDRLRAWNLKVTTLPAEATLPDSVFVEDTAVILPEITIVARLGTASRAPEADLMAGPLAVLCARPIVRMQPPARLEGGDVLRVGRRLFVGQGPRTDERGLAAFASIVKQYGYDVMPVPVTGCLHLKTACTALSDDTLLINPDWVDAASFEGFDLVPVAPDEPFAGNVLRVGERLAIPDGFPETTGRILGKGFNVETIDISEFRKAEAGLTCLSLIGCAAPRSLPRRIPRRG